MVIFQWLVVEVLSPSTADYDRGEKLRHYKEVESLRELLLVDQDEQLVEHWQRRADGSWGREVAATGGKVELTSVDCGLAVAEIYRDDLSAED